LEKYPNFSPDKASETRKKTDGCEISVKNGQPIRHYGNQILAGCDTCCMYRMIFNALFMFFFVFFVIIQFDKTVLQLSYVGS